MFSARVLLKNLPLGPLGLHAMSVYQPKSGRRSLHSSMRDQNVALSTIALSAAVLVTAADRSMPVSSVVRTTLGMATTEVTRAARWPQRLGHLALGSIDWPPQVTALAVF